MTFAKKMAERIHQKPNPLLTKHIERREAKANSQSLLWRRKLCLGSPRTCHVTNTRTNSLYLQTCEEFA